MQPLEFVIRSPFGERANGGRSRRVMRGELAVEPAPRRQDALGGDQIGQVGDILVGEDRIIVETLFLGALDLAVPIGTLDQPHHQPTVGLARLGHQPVDQRQHTLGIGLNR